MDQQKMPHCYCYHCYYYHHHNCCPDLFFICLSFCRVISFLFTLKQVLIKSIAEPKIVIFLGNFLAGKDFRFGTKICALI